ncbi:hypothetical protein MKK63_11090 [Methylobacterium sp. J-088]|uniref:hypothetical protein n=1 Tax=Methylobacterium sp. J-088 TaxID=2836664 RepID=UPI001FBA7A1A|nr:hypothetical protein [Methylobacterium sp. J-088]MCJ2063255.1 hypothetical protein [Methylobacterium sp. J-088]
MPRRKPDPRRPGPENDPADDSSMAETERHELVAEAAATFGPEAAAELAVALRVPFRAPQPEVQA